MMSTPSERTPSEKALESSTPLSRMSRATRITGTSAKRAMARPMARHMVASSWSGTVPRMSYALKTWSMRVMTGPTLGGWGNGARPPLQPELPDPRPGDPGDEAQHAQEAEELADAVRRGGAVVQRDV